MITIKNSDIDDKCNVPLVIIKITVPMLEMRMIWKIIGLPVVMIMGVVYDNDNSSHNKISNMCSL